MTDRVNVEPPILNGMTATEAKLVGSIASVFWLIVGAAVVYVTGYWQALVAFGLVLPVMSVWWASSRLAGIKRNRPDGFYRQALHRWAAARGLVRSRFITHAGHWSLGRPLFIELNNPRDAG